MVFAGLRAQTIDIDLTYEVEPTDHSEFVQAVRRLKDQLQVNVEARYRPRGRSSPAGVR